ncbi:MAG: class I SAM-dependent methyltransferase [Pseudomonadota bacterium]
MSRIRRQIELNGPMSVAEYMALCLLDPEHGYYTNAEPFGVGGDFTTAPEISQLFGEIIGAWLINAWHALGKPEPFTLAEAGPGRGTLMRDILRTAAIDPAFKNAANPTLIEASQKLRTNQAETLATEAARTVWLDDFDQLPEQALLLVTNEFFDALPIRQFIHHKGRWMERCIGLNDHEALRWQVGTQRITAQELPRGATENEEEGAITEIAPARESVMAKIANHVAKHGGAAINIDYGHAKSGLGDTLQAMQKHEFVDPLIAPGQVDLTSHVDFEALTRVAMFEGAYAFPIKTQGDFLIQCGLLERAGRLGAGKSVKVQDQITADVQRLAGDGDKDMGNLFKVFCVTQKSSTALPPFGS